MRTAHDEYFDLNLLLIFEAILAERSVTGASAELGLTQPTVSHALNRLRKVCDDPLFVRTAHGMQPTAFAEAIAEPLGRALALIRQSMARRDRFDPALDSRFFRLLLTDIGTVSFLPPLIAHLQQHAPAVSIESVQAPLDEYKQALQDGAVDLAIGHMPSIVAGFYQKRIFEDEFVCVVSANHPRIKGPPTLDVYLREDHVRVVLPGRPISAIDQCLSDLNQVRKVKLTVPQYLALLPILASSELVGTVPFRVFHAMRSSGELRMYPLPFKPPTVLVHLFWHERKHADPGLTWLRQTISSLFENSVAPPA